MEPPDTWSVLMFKSTFLLDQGDNVGLRGQYLLRMGMGAWIHHLYTSLWNSHLSDCHVTNKARSRVWGRLRNNGDIFSFSNFFCSEFVLKLFTYVPFLLSDCLRCPYFLRSLRLIAELNSPPFWISCDERRLDRIQGQLVFVQEGGLSKLTIARKYGRLNSRFILWPLKDIWVLLSLHSGITLNLSAKGLLLHPDSTNSYHFFRAPTLSLAPRSTK